MGGLGGGLPIPVGLGGGGTLVVIIAFVLLNLLGGGGGGSLGSALDPLGGQPVVQPGQAVDLDDNGNLVEFVGYVLDDANALWADTFERSGRSYQPATLVLFTESTRSGCGIGSAATGPFYCPLDQKVYLDLDFFRELRTRFGARGDFAQAYVIAHEVAHHVQQQTGLEARVRQAQAEDPASANELSIALELQADCLAGVWAQSVLEQGDLEPGDVEEGLAAASAVGDDRIQASSGVGVNQETWTHGSAAQRAGWFETGYDTGDPAACDTFGG